MVVEGSWVRVLLGGIKNSREGIICASRTVSQGLVPHPLLRNGDGTTGETAEAGIQAIGRDREKTL